MRKAAGQVARWLHGLAHLALGLATVLLLVLAVLGWRLAQGPIELPMLAQVLEQRFNERNVETRLEVGRAAIAWEGWAGAGLTPLELQISAVRLLGADGSLRGALPEAAVSLSIPWLLRGELAPRRLELRYPVLLLRRDADGALSLLVDGAAPGPEAREGAARSRTLAELLATMMRPPAEDTPLGALAWLGITGATVTVEDAQLGATWRLEEAAIELRRLPGGGVGGVGDAMLALGEARVAVQGSGEARGTPAEIGLRLVLPAVRPAALSGLAPPLAPLAGLDALARLELTARLDADGVMREAGGVLAARAGALDLGGGRRIPVAGVSGSLRWEPGRLILPRAVLRLDGAGTPTVTAAAEAHLQDGRWLAEARLGLDAAPLAELARWWPEGLGSGERDWILANITDGTAHDGEWRLAAEAEGDFSGLRLTDVEGRLGIRDATVHWLRPIPPVEGATGQVRFALDEVTVHVAEARQQGRRVQAREAVLRFLFHEPDGTAQAELQIPLAGPVPDVLAVLQHPRLRLFEQRPLPLTNPQGTLDGRLELGFPLLADLAVEQLRIRAQAQLRAVRLGDVLLGRPLERGQFELALDNDGLRVAGTATLAEIAARLGVEMDFRSGPATQVVMRETVQARADARQLASLGLASEELVRGMVGLDVRSERRRNGAGRVAVRADLREATLAIEPLGWTKGRGQNAGGEAVLRLAGERLEAIESFRLEAPDLLLRGNAAFAAGARVQRVTINEGRIEGSRFAGEARPPPREGAPWLVVLRGATLDLRRVMAEETPAAPSSPPAEPGPAVALEARFERVLLGPARELAQVEARVLVDGRGVLREGRLGGRAGARGDFEATITQVPTRYGAGRRLRASTQDAGALLSRFGLLEHLEGGRLAVEATWPHNAPGAPLSGVAEMEEFSVRQAPAFGKLLQAMTLYGLVEAMSGPGLGFSRLVAPFTLTPEALTLGEARAFSASLGLTARGTLDRRRNTLAMEGTIVPAYVFNSLLGNIPVFGRLFSPETGGGVFAATWRAQGPLDDPQVSVNPLAALTPGFLRGLFGIGQPQPTPRSPVP